LALKSAAIALAVSVLGLAWILGHGAAGLGYVALFALLLLPGLPLGFYLFGARHAAGWIAGGLIGYALSAVVLWVPADLGLTAQVWLPGAWAALTAATHLFVRGGHAVVPLPPWQRADTVALLCAMLLVPLIVSVPFSRVGERDADGNLRYRAYFTADFLWHVALTEELAKADPPPRNPYLERRALNYYWAYFVPPAMIARSVGATHSFEACLLLNALCAGLLFVASIYVYGWCVIPRAGPMLVAVLITMLAASAEGFLALIRLARDDLPLASLRNLNVDAVTAWIFQGLTIDSLPRSLWYTPQHAAACALGLIALVASAAAPSRLQPMTALVAGVPLGLSIVFSPFLGGVFCVIYAVATIWLSLTDSDRPFPSIAAGAVAALPAAVGLAWCLANQTFEGAGGSVKIGISPRAAAAPFTTLALAVGPVLALAIGGLVVGRSRRYRWHASVAGLAIGLTLFHFVYLSSEPVWVGWRAGQIMLVTAPAIIAVFFAHLVDASRRSLAAIAAALALAIGLPTTVIDTWNAQDVEHVAMGPGFRWTVVVPPATQAAMKWLRQRTPAEAIVQMSIGPRGRETWTLVPTFAGRRMAAGQPISLLHLSEYDQRSGAVDAMFRTTSAAEASRVAHSHRIDYVFVDRVERNAFGAAAIGKFSDPQYFEPVFEEGDAAVFQVR
jgi:hypothetical protein